MFKWLKNIFGSKPEPLVLTKEQRVETKVEPVAAKPAPVVEPKVEQAKPVAKPKTQAKKPAPKPTVKKPVAEAPKRGRKKDGVTKTDLNKMNKDELEAFAKKEFKVDLDKRKRKSDLVDQVLKLVAKNVK